MLSLVHVILMNQYRQRGGSPCGGKGGSYRTRPCTSHVIILNRFNLKVHTQANPQCPPNCMPRLGELDSAIWMLQALQTLLHATHVRPAARL